jgi:hypothetical protein
VWLPRWSQHAGIWKSPVSSTEFRIAAVLLAILAYLVTYWSIRSGRESIGTYVLIGFAFAMLLNVIYHVGATIGLHEYAPGVVTAVLVILPVMAYLLRRTFREQWVTWPRALLAFTIVPVAILLLIPCLFFVGRTIASALRIWGSGSNLSQNLIKHNPSGIQVQLKMVFRSLSTRNLRRTGIVRPLRAARHQRFLMDEPLLPRPATPTPVPSASIGPAMDSLAPKSNLHRNRLRSSPGGPPLPGTPNC